MFLDALWLKFGPGVVSGDIAGASSHAAHRRRGANGRNECLGFFRELETLAPDMAFFGCQPHGCLPVNCPEIVLLFSSPSVKYT